jgi:cation:H+ antiporter
VSTALRLLIFAAGVVVSLGASWILVSRLERLGHRLGFSEALLGMLAAFAADTPEITTAVTALAGHDRRVGAGVVLGANAFNLAVLLGVSALIAGFIALHRRVIVMSGAVALWVAVVCLAEVRGAFTPLVALALALAALLPYAAILGAGRRQVARLPFRASWLHWLDQAIGEEEQELAGVIAAAGGDARDGAVAALALLVVVGASVAMEHAATALGRHYSIAGILVGALVLAAVTSLPNAVAGVYLALRGRGAAALSTALNSNMINVVAGLLIPGSLVGLGAPSHQTSLVAAAYLALTVLALTAAYLARGLRRATGAVIVAVYAAFTIALIVSASG